VRGFAANENRRGEGRLYIPRRQDKQELPLTGMADQAGRDEVSGLRNENDQLKQLVAELSLKNRILKNSLSGLE